MPILRPLMVAMLVSIFLLSACASNQNKDMPKLVVSGPIKEKDVIWDKDTSKYKTEILVVLNRLVKENKHCAKKITTRDTMRSGLRGSRKDPVFFVPCGTGYDVHNIWFRPKDAYKKSLAPPKPILGHKALSVCQQEVKKKLNHPQTFSMNFMDNAFKVYASGRARQGFGFKAKNAFGLESRYRADCLFENNHKVLDVIITQE